MKHDCEQTTSQDTRLGICTVLLAVFLRAVLQSARAHCTPGEVGGALAALHEKQNGPGEVYSGSQADLFRGIGIMHSVHGVYSPKHPNFPKHH